MAAALLEARLREIGVDPAVTSAGTHEGGQSAWPDATAVLRSRGIDISGHVSREITVEDIADADLVVAMAREHVRDVVALVPDAFPRTFTLKELVRRGESAPRSDEPLHRWLRRLSAGREPSMLLGRSDDDDIADPIGGPTRKFRATAAELDDLAMRLARVGWNE